MALKWPWSRPEIRSSSYTDVIQTALYDHALGSVGKPQPSGNVHGARLLPPVVGCRVFVRRWSLPVVRC